jgi:hypothetical protein
MSRNVIIKALLPHRDTISTMIVSPRLPRPELYISGSKKCMPHVSNPRQNPHFSERYVATECTAIAHGNRLRDELPADQGLAADRSAAASISMGCARLPPP